MGDSDRRPKTIRFGDHEVDIQTGELYKHGVKIRLRDKSFDVLASLLEHPGEVVTREELRRRLWPADVFVDFDNNLNTAVAALREALRDSAEKPRFIETLPRRGYRFIAPVSTRGSSPGEPARRKLKLAVLPFDDLSGDPSQEYFSEGMTEELITELAALAPQELGVIARTSSMRYKGSRKEVARVGRELDVEYVVEGSVRRAGDQVRVSAQLVRVNDRTNLWAKSYDGELRDSLKLQGELARAIARQIDIAVSPAARLRWARIRPLDPDAHDAYLRGLCQFSKASPSGFAKAAECFRLAVERDSEFAPAYAKLAMNHAMSSLFGYVPASEAFAGAEAAACRALQLDDTLSDAHSALAVVRWFRDWDLAACEHEAERAVALGPNEPTAHWTLAMFLGSMKEDHQRAATEIGLAQALDPLSMIIRSQAGWIYFWARDYDRAIAQARGALELDENCPQAYYVLGTTSKSKGRFDEALTALQQAYRRFGDVFSLAYLGMTHALAGDRDLARATLRRLEESAGSHGVPSIYPAYVYTGLGEHDRAIEHLEKALGEHDAMVLFLRVSPDWDTLRPDPRFQRLLRRLDLPPAVGP